MRRVVVLLALGAVAFFAAAPSVEAHALVGSSDPAAGTQIDAAPSEVTIVFTEEPELAFSSIEVLDEAGTSVDRGDTTVVRGDERALRVGVALPGQGVYTVVWRVISRVDGHATAGAFAFGFGVDPSTAALAEIELGTEEPVPSALEIIARWMLFVGLGLLVGVAWVAAAAFPAPTPRMWRLLVIGWVAGVAGVALLAEAQRRPTGQGIGTLLGTSIGRALIWRAVAVVVAGLALLVAHRLRTRGGLAWGRPGRSASLLWLAGGAAVAAIFIHASAGHAGTGDMLWFKVAGQAVHVTAVGVWLGGLAALLAGLRDADATTIAIGEDVDRDEVLARLQNVRPRAVRRFSTVAGVMLVLVVLTGIARTVNELPAFSALWDGWYGRVILIKVALLGLLALLGGVNRYRNIPRSEQRFDRLRRVSRAELIVAALTLVAAGALATLSPPVASAGGPGGARGPLELRGADFAGTTEVRLTVDPGYAGPNTFTARVADARDGEAITGATVRLLFSFLDDPVGDSELALGEGEPGLYAAVGTGMALDGRWRITVLVQRAAASAEIELVTATRCRATTIPVPDGPTLYDVQLSGGVTAQGYADPGREGFNEIHMTYFDEQGQELDIGDEPRFTATPRGGDPMALVVRRFGPGHFIGDAQLEPGVYRFDVSVPIGEQAVRACFDTTIVE